MSASDVPPIPKAVVLTIHEDQLKRNGGMPGIRDEGLLDSALAQPYASFAGQELCPSIPEKAARYGFGIIKNHPFADGNKRTGAALIIAFLRGNGLSFKPRSEDFYDTVIAVADGTMDYDELVAWIERQLSED
jgi:death-on-curing protein